MEMMKVTIPGRSPVTFPRPGKPSPSIPGYAVVPVFEHLLLRRNLERTHNAEAEERGVGHIPDALGQLRVFFFPPFFGVQPRRAAQHRGIAFAKPAAPHDVRIGYSR